MLRSHHLFWAAPAPDFQCPGDDSGQMGPVPALGTKSSSAHKKLLLLQILVGILFVFINWTDFTLFTRTSLFFFAFLKLKDPAGATLKLAAPQRCSCMHVVGHAGPRILRVDPQLPLYTSGEGIHHFTTRTQKLSKLKFDFCKKKHITVLGGRKQTMTSPSLD